jgi:hypothetical protein
MTQAAEDIHFGKVEVEPSEPKAEKSAAPKPAEAKAHGLELTNLNEYWQFAKIIYASGLAPKPLDSIEKIFIAIQFGAELGIAPMRSLDSVAVIHNRPALWGDAVLGLCMSSGIFDHEVYREWFTGSETAGDWTAHTEVRRLGGQTIVRTFSINDAKRANLWKAKDKPTWTTNPDRMLKYRARTFALRDAFPDVLQGLHSVEEMADADALLSRLDLDHTTEQLTDRATQVAAAATKQVERVAPAPPSPPVNETIPKGLKPKPAKTAEPKPKPNKLGETTFGKIQAAAARLEPTKRAEVLAQHGLGPKSPVGAKAT